MLRVLTEEESNIVIEYLENGQGNDALNYIWTLLRLNLDKSKMYIDSYFYKNNNGLYIYHV